MAAQMYHVVSDDWTEGCDLLSYDEQEAQYGAAPAWKWDGEPFDIDVICLYETLGEAIEHRATFDAGSRILAVIVADDEHDSLPMTRVGEGFPAVFTRIPADRLSVLDA